MIVRVFYIPSVSHNITGTLMSLVMCNSSRMSRRLHSCTKLLH